MAALAAAQPQEAVSQDAAIQEGAESSLMNRGSLPPVLASVRAIKLAECCCTRRYSVLWSMALVVNRGAIGRPLGLPADGLHDGLPRW